MKTTLHQIIKFGIVGVIGFIVDLGIFSVLLKLVGPYGARGISFLGAVLCTWLLNRQFTFESTETSKSREFATYTLIMCIGGAVNLLFFTGTMQVLGKTWSFGPHLSLAVGSLAGMFANYILARTIVFKQ